MGKQQARFNSGNLRSTGQSHYNFGGAQHHSGGSKSAAKKAIESYWPFVQTQLAKLSDPVVGAEAKDLHKSVSRYGLQRLTGYQAAGGTYGPTVKAFVSACNEQLANLLEQQFEASDTTMSRRDFTIAFEHEVNALVQQYEAQLTMLSRQA